MRLAAAALPKEAEFLIPPELGTRDQEAYVWSCGSSVCLTVLGLLKNGVYAVVVEITTKAGKDTGQSLGRS